jgi:hypothetical protein
MGALIIGQTVAVATSTSATRAACGMDKSVDAPGDEDEDDEENDDDYCDDDVFLHGCGCGSMER